MIGSADGEGVAEVAFQLRKRVVGVTRINVFQRLDFSSNPSQARRVKRFKPTRNTNVVNG